MVIFLLLAGLLIGASFGATGAGGAVLSIPALVLLGGVDLHAAIAAGPWVVVAMAMYTAVADWRASRPEQFRARVKTAFALALPGIPGALLGAWLSHQLSENFLSGLFLALVAWAAWRMARAPGPCAEIEGTGKASAVSPTAVLMGLGLGLMSGLLGIGGGFLAVPLMVLLFEYCAQPAARISVWLVLLNGLWALLSHVAMGGLPMEALRAVLILLASGLVGIPAGMWVRKVASEMTLRRGFAALLVASAVLMQLR